MPRPDRYREREAGAGDPPSPDPKPGDPPAVADAAKPAAREGLVGRGRERVAQAEAHAPLDEGEERGQGSRTGHVTAEGRGADPEEAIAEKVARRLGWVPQAEWTRDPTKWVPASQYLDSTPSRIEGLRDRLSRSERAAGAAIDEAQRRAREEAEAEVRRFAAEGKPEEAAQAARRLADAAPRPNDEARRWVEDRPWLQDDPVAGAAALAITNVGASQGKSIPEQLEMADQELRRLRPERYGTRQDPDAAPDSRQEQRQDRRETRQPPDMAGGARSGGGNGGRRKEKGFADIPAADRETFNRTFRPRGIGEESYARSYWRNKGE